MVSTQPLHRVVRDLLAPFVTGTPPATIDEPFSPAGFRLRIQRIRVRGTDELLAPFSIRAPASVTHHLYSTSISCPGLPEEDANVVRAEIEATIFRYLNPLTYAPGQHHTVWLLSETEQQQATRVLTLRPEDEAAYIFQAGQTAQWTGPTRGLHKSMATLAQFLSRHSDFVTGKLLCRPPAGFLFLGDRKSLERAPQTGISTDGRAEPTRGVFAIDQASYLDALIQLGEEEARDLAVAEFTHNGQCLRAHGPLGIPIYRIPHLIPASAIRSVTVVAENEVVYERPSGPVG
jgi:hypothetical protein